MQTMSTSSAQTPSILATEAATAAQQNAAAQARGTAVQSEELLQGKKAVEISHNGAIYRLQATKLGKLILTK